MDETRVQGKNNSPFHDLMKFDQTSATKIESSPIMTKPSIKLQKEHKKIHEIQQKQKSLNFSSLVRKKNCKHSWSLRQKFLLNKDF